MEPNQQNLALEEPFISTGVTREPNGQVSLPNELPEWPVCPFRQWRGQLFCPRANFLNVIICPCNNVIDVTQTSLMDDQRCMSHADNSNISSCPYLRKNHFKSSKSNPSFHVQNIQYLAVLPPQFLPNHPSTPSSPQTNNFSKLFCMSLYLFTGNLIVWSKKIINIGSWLLSRFHNWFS